MRWFGNQRIFEWYGDEYRWQITILLLTAKVSSSYQIKASTPFPRRRILGNHFSENA